MATAVRKSLPGRYESENRPEVRSGIVAAIAAPEKTRSQVAGRLGAVSGIFSGLSGQEYSGYEIHMGNTAAYGGKELPVLVNSKNAYGTYVHSIFDSGNIAKEIVMSLARRKGIELETPEAADYSKIKEREYDRLADLIRSGMDMEAVYAMLAEARV